MRINLRQTELESDEQEAVLNDLTILKICVLAGVNLGIFWN